MFTGIIETMGEVKALERKETNLHITVRSDLSHELKIDQSVSHNGVCLTVININADMHTAIVVNETLQKTNISRLKLHESVNLERSLQMNGRIDGHIVQGHVDQTGICKNIENKNGSWLFTFEHEQLKNNITIEKGSVCVNGVSLTVVDTRIQNEKNSFTVAVIPYTFEYTNFKFMKAGDTVNLEFDIIGKYVAKFLDERN